jgi:ribonuclease PH
LTNDDRAPDQLRPLKFTRAFTENAPGSVLVESGRTKVLCTACVEEGVPPFLLNSNKGWVTAEYSMLPGSTGRRKARDGRRGSADSRSLEIGRLIGRSLRSVIQLQRLPGRSLWIDCDVIQADGGTRTASISGAVLAAHDAFTHMKEQGWLRGWPLTSLVAATSVGVIDGTCHLDLDYPLDSRADVDLNVVMNSQLEYVEIQGGGEGTTFAASRLQELLDLASRGIESILDKQREVLGVEKGASK